MLRYATFFFFCILRRNSIKTTFSLVNNFNIVGEDFKYGYNLGLMHSNTTEED